MNDRVFSMRRKRTSSQKSDKNISGKRKQNRDSQATRKILPGGIKTSTSRQLRGKVWQTIMPENYRRFSLKIS